MNLRSRSMLLPWSVLLLLLVAHAASATTVYGTYVGTNVTFGGVQETSTYGDPEPLFGAPIVLGNQLLFFPANFSANSIDGVSDFTGSQLQTTISGNGSLDVIDTLLLTEFGDTDLSGLGTAATGTYIGVSGFVTVLETTSGPIAPVAIPFVGVFSPTGTFDLISNPGTTVFSGGFTVDVASSVPNATKVYLSLDNDLFAFSELGTASSIQKKVTSGPAISVAVIPEPGTAVLLGVGLGLVGLRSRARDR
jgi:hypothetical protein